MLDVKFDMCVKSHYMTKLISQMTAANERGNYFTSVIGSTRRQNFMQGLVVEKQEEEQAQPPQTAALVDDDSRIRSFIQD